MASSDQQNEVQYEERESLYLLKFRCYVDFFSIDSNIFKFNFPIPNILKITISKIVKSLDNNLNFKIFLI